MNTAINKLTIRTQLPLVDTSEKVVPPDEVVYLWDRIIIAALLAVALVGASGYGAWRWVHKSQTSIEATAEPAIAADTQAYAPADVQPTDIGPAEIAHPAEAHVVHTEESITKAVPSSPSTAASVSATQTAPAVKAAQPAHELPSSSAATKLSSSAVGSGKVSVLSKNVSRAYLSRSMNQQNPSEPAPTVFSLSERGLVKVYFMTELVNMKGESVVYEWYLGKKLMAKVRSRPTSDPAKTYSSKFMDVGMLGQWRVELNTEDGATLARADFEVR